MRVLCLEMSVSKCNKLQGAIVLPPCNLETRNIQSSASFPPNNLRSRAWDSWRRDPVKLFNPRNFIPRQIWCQPPDNLFSWGIFSLALSFTCKPTTANANAFMVSFHLDLSQLEITSQTPLFKKLKLGTLTLKLALTLEILIGLLVGIGALLLLSMACDCVKSIFGEISKVVSFLAHFLLGVVRDSLELSSLPHHTAQHHHQSSNT